MTLSWILLFIKVIFQKRVSVTTKPELYSFFGINLVMRYHELPSWKNYWNIEPDFSVPFISNALPRNRFLQILSNIHVNDNRSAPKNIKLRPLIDHMNMNYLKLYNVSRQVSIDESMIVFKGKE